MHSAPWRTGLCLLFSLLLCFRPSDAAAQQPGGAPVVALPAQPSTAKLQTHTSDIVLDGLGGASVKAFYRLRNESSQPALVTVLLTAPTAAATTPLPADLTITAGGESLDWQSTPEGGQVLVTVPASGRLDLRLAYSLDVEGNGVQGVAYPASALDAWPGETSFRLTINVPPAIPRDSWLRIAPEGWRFGVTDGDDAAAIQWLYEGNLPAAPLTFDYVAPALWQEISIHRDAAAAGGVAELVALGASYARLATQAADAGVRDRYYGQALAAYSTALDRGAVTAATPADLAPAYAGQAALYRARILNSGGAASPEHAQLLVESVAKALEGMPADAPARAELQQWFNDGLAIVLTNARQQRDWQTALYTLDQLAAAGGGIDQQTIEEERRRILFEQSLQLLEEGQRDEAVAVAGGGIVGQELRPPAEVQSLFTSWQSTVTVGANGTQITFAGTPAEGRAADATSASQLLAETIADAASNDGARVAFTPPLVDDPASPAVFTIHLPAGETALALANGIPLKPDWTLLRSVLTQIAPDSESTGGFLRRNLLLRLPLDLRSAGAEWRRLAAELDKGAQTLEARSQPADRTQSASLEEALQTRVQAANYRAEANHWSSLVDNSQVVVLLEGPRGAPDDARAWQLTVNDPPQTLQYATWGINYGGLLALVAAILAAVLLLATVLWSLL